MPVDCSNSSVSDGDLLRQYAEDRSQLAFTELVRRHVNLVYFAALRRVGGDAHLADEVAQTVFSDLARKAVSLQARVTLAGWLYTSTRFAAAQAVRAERRRRNHEQEAHTMQELHSSPEEDWERLRPVIDEAMDALNERDREAVLLRFFENLSLADVGEKLSLSPDAARMRVERALQKLHRLLAKRGIASTSAALATAFATQSGAAAPVELVAKIVAAAIWPAAAATTATSLVVLKVLAALALVGAAAGLVVHESRRSLPLEQVPAPASTAAPQAHAQSSVFTGQTQKPGQAASASPPAATPVRTRKRTADFGWPEISLFAGDETYTPQHTTAEFRAKMRTDPDFEEAVVQQAKERLGLFYGHLFGTLNLTPDQLDRFKDLLVEKERLRLDTLVAEQSLGSRTKANRALIDQEVSQGQNQVDAEIRAVIGEQNYVQYLQYREDLVQWTAVNELTERLRSTPTPLTEQQAAQLVVVLRRSLIRIRGPYTFSISIASGAFPAHLGSGLTRKTLQEAATFLSPPQVEALRHLQKAQSKKLN